MNSKKYQKQIILFIISAFLIIAGCIVLIVIKTDEKFQKEKSNIIGLVMTGGIGEDGWNGKQYNAIKQACDNNGYKLITKEYVSEGSSECENAVNELLEEGVSAVFLSSFNYPKEITALIESNDDIDFFVISSEYNQENIHSFFPRMYEARYLSGIIAGLVTKTNQIGYVAAIENPEVIRGIDSFALGVQSVNKDATVNVIYTGSWNDEKKERENVNKLIDNKNTDIITYHQNRSYVVDECEKKNVYSIGYNNTFENVSDKVLTSSICNWNAIYDIILKDLKRNNPQKKYWLGIDSDAVMLSDYSPVIPENIKDKVEKAKNDILNDKYIFSGEIFDNKGKIRCQRSETISDSELFNKLDWYTKGVEIYDCD